MKNKFFNFNFQNFVLFSVLCSLLTVNCCSSSLFAGVTGDESKADSIALPHIGIHLNITNIGSKLISGYADITVKALVNNVSTINLDLNKFTVDLVKVNNNTTSFIYKSPNVLLQIPLSASINTGDTVNLKIYYHGTPTGNAGTGGFQFSGTQYAYNEGCDMKQVPHSVGRDWFPCIDDHRTRSTFDYYITTDTTHNTACGGLLVSTTVNTDTTRTYHWYLSNSVPSYLSSVAVANYTATHDTVHSILGTTIPIIYNFVSDDVGGVATVKSYFTNFHKIFHFYEKQFGPYRWQKVGFTGTTFNPGAMEHATNIALPNLVVEIGSMYEWVYAHEFSHHWFGDLVTCATEGDMWLNEGWAHFCQIYYEEGIYSKAKFKADMRSWHYTNLLSTAPVDKGYFPLFNVPSSVTYGNTVYDKGSDIVHTLRGYLGDNRFFGTVKKYTQQFQFTSMSSPEFANFWSVNSGLDIHDFMNAWVYAPGLPHFSVDSFKVSPQGSSFNVEVFARQRLWHANSFADSNRLEITFMKNDWETFTDTLMFSGEFGDKHFTVPFQPDFVIIDKEEKIADATTDNYKTIKTTGYASFPYTFFSLTVNQITDSAFVRAERSWIPPDNFKKQIGYKITNTGYWKIDGIFPDGFNSVGVFSYNSVATDNNGLSCNVDKAFLPTATSYDSLVLLYRANTKADWQVIPFTISGTATSGKLTTKNNLLPGEYCLGKGTYTSIQNLTSDIQNFNVYPNPSSGVFRIDYNINEKVILKIFNLQGILLQNINIPNGHNIIDWQPTDLSYGTYIIALFSLDNRYIARKNVVYIK